MIPNSKNSIYMKTLDDAYLEQDEPIRGCFLALRTIILSQDAAITNVLKYGMPFFCYKQKMFCYFWIHKKFKQPYIGFVEGNRLDYPDLITEKRARMKILLVDPNKDLPLQAIETILKTALDLYRTGAIKINSRH
jgi:Domain of unknown function (DU1801)